MPRTKYIVIILSMLIVLLVGYGIYLLLHRSADMAFGSGGNTALAIQADRAPIVATVQKNTLREDTRATLRAELQNSQVLHAASPGSSRRTIEVLEDTDTSMVTPDVAMPTCVAQTIPLQPTVESWGLVNSALAEGARVIKSLEVTASSTPKYRLQIPELPNVAETPQCLSQGSMIGVALDGRVITAGMPLSTDAEGVIGYAIDGFGIFGTYENGSVVQNTDLDQCHGHVHTIVWSGLPMSLYHYHVTAETPYTLGCFRGVPVAVP
jgi:hypothetical protein